ncbi:MAG: alpha/beta fold hydrolase [Clostridia bacterium]|nr:alpha/beta fold hydrolase [Clostridia bacterium]
MKNWLIMLLCALLFPVSCGLCETSAETQNAILEEDVFIGDPALPGALTLPQDDSSPLPAVVLLHGSGPNDRDETIGQTKMFQDLAEGLARQGIAVLRYDKRTFVYGSTYTKEDLNTLTVREEAMNDAVTAAEYLRSDPRIDPDRIYLIGHSMGAMIAPRIAWENSGLFSGIILLSGTPKTLGEIVLSQNQALVDALPASQRLIGRLQMRILRDQWDKLMALSAEEAKGVQIFDQPGYYFWEAAQYDTASILQNLSLPVLILNGGADFQIINADGIDAWQSLNLPDSVRIHYFPFFNHLLMQPDAPKEIHGTVQEYNIPCHVSPDVLSEITKFIQQ